MQLRKVYIKRYRKVDMSNTITKYKDDIIAYYNKGYSIKDICILVPLSYTEIVEIIKLYCNKSERQESIRGKKALMQQAVKDGLRDVQELCNRFNVTKNTVYAYVRVGHRKPYNNAESKSRAILADLQKGGLTMAEIARKYGVSRQTVFKVKKNYLQT